MKRQYQFIFRKDGSVGTKISDIIIGDRFSIVDGDVVILRVSDCFDHGYDAATKLFHAYTRGRNGRNQNNSASVHNSDKMSTVQAAFTSAI